jgi:hypothetical protein
MLTLLTEIILGSLSFYFRRNGAFFALRRRRNLQGRVKSDLLEEVQGPGILIAKEAGIDYVMFLDAD